MRVLYFCVLIIVSHVLPAGAIERSHESSSREFVQLEAIDRETAQKQTMSIASAATAAPSKPSSVSLSSNGLITWSYADGSTPSHHLVEYRKIDSPSGSWLEEASPSAISETGKFDLAIFSGSATSIADHPYQVHVTLSVGPSYEVSSCGGVLLSPIWVLTAAHCTYSKDFPQLQATVGFGKTKVSDLTADDLRESETVMKHQAFEEDRLQNDVALIKLKSPVDMTRAGTLPIFDFEESLDGQPAYATGWGRLSTRSRPSDSLRGTTLVIEEACRSWANVLPNFDSRPVVCAGANTGSSICGGDSGGPLVVNRNGVLYLAGVSSYTSTLYGCDSRILRSAFARASLFKSWIETYVGSLWHQTQTFESRVHTIESFDPSAQYAIRIRPSNYSFQGEQGTWILSATSTSSPSVGMTSGSEGYWLLEADGQVYSFGDALELGDPSSVISKQGSYAIDIESTSGGKGYWVLDSRGKFHRFGDAELIPNAQLGNLKSLYNFGLSANRPEVVVSSIPTQSGRGAYVFTNIGRVIRVGDASAISDLSGREDLLWISQLNAPIVDARLSPDGRGYWMLSADGGIFTFGTATFAGSVPDKPRSDWINEEIVSFSANESGSGYVVVAKSGKAWWFNFEERPQLPNVLLETFGSSRLNSPIAAVMTRSCGGYLMVANDGGVFATPMSDCGFQGSLGANPPNTDIVALSPIP